MPELTPILVVQILGAVASLLYLFLLMRERVLCWPFGIVGSLLSVYLFLHAKLYSEAVLYFFYAVMGVWGWLRWHRRELAHNNPVITRSLAFHLRAIILTSLVALGVGYFMTTYTDAQRPVIDAFTTAFSFFATYLQVAKVLESWLYWIVLNVVAIWLYQDRALDIYAALIAIYAVLSVSGYITWRRSAATS
jgi:nicotinamide mononucleotide transporter